tara:strand:- start:559 stop:891 length:333 start_codon:yes stop_codon:yes gene_type:complete
MIIYVDIDETICNTPGDALTARDYNLAEPIPDNIEKINEYYGHGHEIVYWTARGSKSGIDWRDVTYAQLKSWGAKFHELKLGKPAYDIFIDDKVLNSRDWELSHRIIDNP